MHRLGANLSEQHLNSGDHRADSVGPLLMHHPPPLNLCRGPGWPVMGPEAVPGFAAGTHPVFYVPATSSPYTVCMPVVPPVHIGDERLRPLMQPPPRHFPTLPVPSLPGQEWSKTSSPAPLSRLEPSRGGTQLQLPPIQTHILKRNPCSADNKERTQDPINAVQLKTQNAQRTELPHIPSPLHSLGPGQTGRPTGVVSSLEKWRLDRTYLTPKASPELPHCPRKHSSPLRGDSPLVLPQISRHYSPPHEESIKMESDHQDRLNDFDDCRTLRRSKRHAPDDPSSARKQISFPVSVCPPKPTRLSLTSGDEQRDKQNEDVAISVILSRPTSAQPVNLANGRYGCPLCAKSYKHSKHVRRHIINHTKLFPFTCPVCSVEFRRKDAFRRHMHNLHPTAKMPTDGLLKHTVRRFVETTPRVCGAQQACGAQ